MNPADNKLDINFIPQEIVQKRQEVVNRSNNNKFAIFTLVAVVIISAVAFYFNYSLQNELAALDSKISSNESRINDLQEFGKHGYKMGLRLNNADTIIATRNNYSYLLEEFALRVPEGINITSLSSTNNTLSLTGSTVAGYPIIADFQDKLMQKTQGQKNMFEDVRLTSSQFNKSTGQIEFTLEIDLNNEIKKGGNN